MLIFLKKILISGSLIVLFGFLIFTAGAQTTQTQPVSGFTPIAPIGAPVTPSYTPPPTYPTQPTTVPTVRPFVPADLSQPSTIFTPTAPISKSVVAVQPRITRPAPVRTITTVEPPLVLSAPKPVRGDSEFPELFSELERTEFAPNNNLVLTRPSNNQIFISMTASRATIREVSIEYIDPETGRVFGRGTQNLPLKAGDNLVRFSWPKTGYIDEVLFGLKVSPSATGLTTGIVGGDAVVFSRPTILGAGLPGAPLPKNSYERLAIAVTAEPKYKEKTVEVGDFKVILEERVVGGHIKVKVKVRGKVTRVVTDGRNVLRTVTGEIDILTGEGIEYDPANPPTGALAAQRAKSKARSSAFDDGGDYNGTAFEFIADPNLGDPNYSGRGLTADGVRDLQPGEMLERGEGNKGGLTGAELDKFVYGDTETSPEALPRDIIKKALEEKFKEILGPKRETTPVRKPTKVSDGGAPTGPAGGGGGTGPVPPPSRGFETLLQKLDENDGLVYPARIDGHDIEIVEKRKGNRVYVWVSVDGGRMHADGYEYSAGDNHNKPSPHKSRSIEAGGIVVEWSPYKTANTTVDENNEMMRAIDKALKEKLARITNGTWPPPKPTEPVPFEPKSEPAPTEPTAPTLEDTRPTGPTGPEPPRPTEQPPVKPARPTVAIPPKDYSETTHIPNPFDEAGIAKKMNGALDVLLESKGKMRSGGLKAKFGTLNSDLEVAERTIKADMPVIVLEVQGKYFGVGGSHLIIIPIKPSSEGGPSAEEVQALLNGALKNFMIKGQQGADRDAVIKALAKWKLGGKSTTDIDFGAGTFDKAGEVLNKIGMDVGASVYIPGSKIR